MGAELHILKVEKLDACIRPFFTNSVTYRLDSRKYFNFVIMCYIMFINKLVELMAKHKSTYMHCYMYVAICFLVMSSYSCDLLMMSLYTHNIT